MATTWTGPFERRAGDALRLRGADPDRQYVCVRFTVDVEMPPGFMLADASATWVLFRGVVDGHRQARSVPVAHVVSVETVPAPPPAPKE